MEYHYRYFYTQKYRRGDSRKRKEKKNKKLMSEIAEMLFLSESTVKTHIYNIFRKMEVKNRVSVICIINEETTEPAGDNTNTSSREES